MSENIAEFENGGSEVIKKLGFIYACEKDSKRVLSYNLIQDSYERREIDMETNFMHNF
jgi:hypothetical protein